MYEGILESRKEKISYLKNYKGFQVNVLRLFITSNP